MDPTALDQAPVTDLARAAYDQLGALARVEVALAWSDARDELRGLQRAAALALVAYTTLVVALTLLAVAAVLAAGATALAAIVAAVVAAGVAAGFGLWAARSVSLAPLEKTRARLQQNVQKIEEMVS